MTKVLFSSNHIQTKPLTSNHNCTMKRETIKLKENFTVKTTYYYCFQAGFCASGGSIFGKLSNVEFSWSENLIVQYTLSAVLIALMLLCNAAVWTFFVKALQSTNSSFIPTLLVAATNYIISAVAGWLVFGESLSFTWCFGTVLILAGITLLASDPNNSPKDKSE